MAQLLPHLPEGHWRKLALERHNHNSIDHYLLAYHQLAANGILGHQANDGGHE